VQYTSDVGGLEVMPPACAGGFSNNLTSLSFLIWPLLLCTGLPPRCYMVPDFLMVQLGVLCKIMGIAQIPYMTAHLINSVSIQHIVSEALSRASVHLTLIH
jgi:hypothetical protein